ncbi:MAG TPA: TonB-dependent receptor [bacterium (Candidatus Stahlbacteria)]|nr:TonB-dependent receptor [Candidatus Stahlbacteria bacterium]
MANFLALFWAFFVITGVEGPYTYWFDELVVTASRVPERLGNIHVDVIVIKEKEIKESRANNLGEILRGKLGIDIRSYGDLGGASSINVRGASSSQVLVLMDGRPLNWISLGACDLSEIGLTNIKRIEIVKGPISSLYGANALGGVVNIITADAEELHVGGSLSYGSYNTKMYTWNAEIGYGNFGILLSGEYKHTDGMRSNSDFDEIISNAKFTYKMDDNYKISMNLGYNDADRGVAGPKPAVGFIPTYGDSTASSLFDRQMDTGFFADLSADFKVGKVKSQVKLYVDDRVQKFLSVYDAYALDWTTYRAEASDKYHTYVFGMNIKSSFTLKGARFTLGMDMRSNRFEGQSLLKNTTTNEVDTTVWNPSSVQAGGWLEIIRKFDLLTLTSSLRYDYDKTYGNFISPSLGLVYKLGRTARFKLFGGRAFREPTFNDLYWPGAGNKDLRPEHGEAYELRIEKQSIPVFMAASIFMRNVRNMIAWAPTGEGNRWQPSNLNKFNAKGVEIELKANLMTGINFGVRGTILSATQVKKEIVYSDWMTGEIRLEERKRDAAIVPKINLSSNLSYESKLGLWVGLDIQYVGKRVNYYPNYSNTPSVTMDTKEMPGTLLLGIRVRQKLAQNIGCSLSVDNLLDTRYAEQFGNSIYDRDYPRPGRNFKIELKLTL